MADNVDVTTVDSVLQTIGFINDGERNGIMAAGLAQFDDFRYLNEKDIRDMADEFGKRTFANERICLRAWTHQETSWRYALGARLLPFQRLA
jgi:hypothetical protein